MVPCNVVTFTTPKKFVLNGLWYGPLKAKRVVVFVHGLTGSVFGDLPRALSPLLADATTAVLAFNNRGFGIVNKIYRNDPRSKKGHTRIVAGSAHEKFVDSVDDLQGAVDFARKTSGGSVYLVGHSTGCQKSIYWAAKKKSRGVKGIILLAPVSDYAVASERKNLKAMVHAAQGLAKRDKKFELLKGEQYDAQRFLSLYTPDSPEELFTYVQPKKNPRMLHSVHTPILVLWAGEDEFNDRSVEEIIGWFKRHLKKLDKVETIVNTNHGFHSAEKQVAREIRSFIQ